MYKRYVDGSRKAAYHASHRGYILFVRHWFEFVTFNGNQRFANNNLFSPLVSKKTYSRYV